MKQLPETVVKWSNPRVVRFVSDQSLSDQGGKVLANCLFFELNAEKKLIKNYAENFDYTPFGSAASLRNNYERKLPRQKAS